MFEIRDQACKLVSVNLRAELHGDSPVPAADLGIQFDSANDILLHWGPWLRESLFWKDGKSIDTPAAQGELESVEPISNLPDLRNPTIDGSLKIKFEGVGYAAEIDFGMGGSSNITLEGVNVNGVKILPKQGGTVQVSLRIQVTEPSADHIGHLGQMIGNEISVSLTPPSAAEQERLQEEAEAEE